MMWTASQIARVTGGRLTDPDRAAASVRGVSIDTRTLVPGEAYLAIRGERLDGHAFVPAAFERGASLAVVAAGDDPDAALPGPGVRVDDTLEALHALAAAARARTDAHVVAVTGSNGKTTTREMIALGLGDPPRVLQPSGNRNNHIGLPLTLCSATGAHRFAVLEMGMSHLGEIHVLSRLARPSLAVITNVGRAHVGPVGGLDRVREAKLEIVDGLDTDAPLLVASDDAELVAAARARWARVEVVGRRGEHRVTRFERRTAGGHEVALDGGPVLVVRAPGRGAAAAAVTAMAVARVLGLDLEEVARRLSRWRPVPGRLALRDGNGYRVLDDSYNANPESMAMALETLAELPCDGRRIAVLGDMRELGDSSADAHRELGERVGDVDAVYLVGEAVAETARVAGDRFPEMPVFYTGDVDVLIDRVRRDITPGDLVLVKASRSSRLERVVDALVMGAPDGGTAD